MTDKTTAALKLAEEALVEYRNNQYVKSPRKALAAIREVLTDQFPDATKKIAKPVKQEPVAVKCGCREGCQYCQGSGWILAEAAPVQPVKQEPVAWMDLHKELGQLCWIGDNEGWENAINAVRKRLEELYAAPVSAEAIRAEALEEAAKWCEENGPKECSMKLISDGFAQGIRGLK